MKQYKALEKSNDYDHVKAEEYAEAVMELRSLQNRREYLEQLIEDHDELREYMWTTAEGVTKPLHLIDDDHLENIMKHLIENRRRIPDQIKAEARSRNLEVPDDNFVSATGGVLTYKQAATQINKLLGDIPF